jgi:hypothetical protein
MWLAVVDSIRSWFQQWAQHYVVPALKAQFKIGLLGILDGMLDALLLLGVPTVAVLGSHAYMDRQYMLPRQAQRQIVKWATLSDQIAREVDVPSVTPLVLWYKEAGLEAMNPDNCEGIMGLHDLVSSGQHACFTPGPIGAAEIEQQLRLGAHEFKARCLQVRYTTTDPNLIKHCYLAYNAGANARMDAARSAYVMNNYDQAHRNMIHRDVQGSTYRLQILGAWPTHLATESLILNLIDSPEGIHLNQSFGYRLLRPLVDSLIRWRDRVANWPDISSVLGPVMHPEQEVGLLAEAWRKPRTPDCLVEPHSGGDPELRPRRNPVVEAPVLTQDLHGCSYMLPGIDIGSSTNPASPLQSPMPGTVTTYTDQWQNTTIRVENAEWIVTMLHPRSYLLREGQVVCGQRVGVMGAQGRATGPHVHFSIYDKIKRAYVDPGAFIPALSQ